MQISNRLTTAASVAGLFYLVSAAGPAFASGPSLGGIAAPVGLSGTDVPCAAAAREALPAGWRLELPGAPALCRSISWRSGNTALGVYERIAAHARLTAVVDVAGKTVTIGARSALEEARGGTDGRRPKGPLAFADTSLRAPLEAIGSRYRLKLQCTAVCERSLPGPVTLELRGDIREDVRLLERAMGPAVPLAIIEDPVTHTLSARAARQPSFSIERPRPNKPWWDRWD